MKLLKSFIFEATWSGDEFIRVWNDAVENGKSVEDVAKHFGISILNASQRAHKLRQAVGDDIKSFPRGGASKKALASRFNAGIERELEMANVYNASSTEVEAASKLNISPATMNKWANINRQRLNLKTFNRRGITANEPKARIKDELFIKIWNSSNDVEDVVDELKKHGINVPKTSASVKATMLRAKGHELKKMEIGMAASKAYDKKHSMEDYDADLAADLEAALNEPDDDEKQSEDPRAAARELFKKMKEKEPDEQTIELSPDELEWSS